MLFVVTPGPAPIRLETLGLFASVSPDPRMVSGTEESSVTFVGRRKEGREGITKGRREEGREEGKEGEREGGREGWEGGKGKTQNKLSETTGERELFELTGF